MFRSTTLRPAFLHAALLGTTALVLLAPSVVFARVGVTSATDGDPLGRPPQEAQRVLRIGIDVQANEAITTGPNDRAHLVFLDGTSLTVGPNAQLTIDKFVYDPNTKTGELAINASKGVLRLVGGKISKTTPITITTPSSSIGIRGGITLLNVQPTQTISTFVFGDRMTVSGLGQTQNVTRPGSQVTAIAGAPPGAPTLAPPGSLGGQISQLEGRTGGSNGSGASGSGGANTAQGGNTASNSQSAEQGARNFSQSSAQATPSAAAPPAPVVTPVTGSASSLGNSVASAAVSNAQQQRTQQNETTTTAPPPGPTTRVIVSYGRYLRDPAYTNFVGTNLSVIPTPANNTTLAPTATIAANNAQITIALSDNRSITLPWQTNTLSSGFSIGTFADPTFGTISGTGYVSASGDYFAYVFTDSNNKKLGFLGGTPTPQSALPTSGIVAHNVTNVGGASDRLPWADATVGDNAALKASASISKLYTAFSTTNSIAVGDPAIATAARSTQMQATISIAGQGAAQQSYSALYVGSIFQDATYAKSSFASGSFNGIYRTSSSGSLGRLVSSESTADTGSGNAIYGTNGPSVMVFVPDNTTSTTTTANGVVTGVVGSRTPAASLDSSPGGTPQIDYMSPNIATATDTPAGIGNSRTTQTLNGFVGGITSNSNGSRTIGTTSKAGDFVLTTDASANRAQALFTVSDWNSGANASANFKMGTTSGTNFATSAFIDDNTYSVRDRSVSAFTDTTSISINGGAASTTGVTPQDFMVSYNSAPTPELFSGANNGAGVTPCTCTYLTWGWWSGQVAYSSSSALTPGQIDRFGLASYVAGNLATTSALNTANQQQSTATYNGHMVGNVAVNAFGGNASANYVAAGSYQNVWSFGSQTGSVTAKFDNSSFSGTTALTASGPGFTGSGLSTNNGAKTLSLNGAFFSAPGDPLKYQAGNFAISGASSTGAGYKAGGTFAGQK